MTWLHPGVLLGPEGAGEREREAERAGTGGQQSGGGDLSARRPPRGHLHPHQQHPSIPPLPIDPHPLPVPSCLIDTFRACLMTSPSSALSSGAGAIYQVLSRCQGRGRKQKIYRFN